MIPNLPNTDELRVLLDWLRTQNYTSENSAASLGTKDTEGFIARLPLYGMMLKPQHNTLDRLFLFHHEIESKSLLEAFEGFPLESAIASGCLQGDQENIQSNFQIIEYDGIYICADWISQKAQPHEQVVMPPSFTTMSLLSSLSVKSSITEFGCGSGIIGIHAAKKSGEHATLSDLNPRAVELTKINALVNDVEISVCIKDWENHLSEVAQPEHIIFNHPSLPLIHQNDLVMMNHSAKSVDLNGQVKSFITALQSVHGPTEVTTWFSLCLSEGETCETLIKAWLSEKTSSFAFKPDTNSPFTLKTEQIEKRKYPFGCWLVSKKEDEEALFDYLESHTINEVTSGVLKLNLSD